MNEDDTKNLKKEDRDINKLQLSTTKDKARLIKVAYKYLITTEKFIVLATVNAIVQTDKQYREFIKENKNNKNNNKLRKDLAEIALSTWYSMNDKIFVYFAFSFSECDLPSFLLPRIKHIDVDDHNLNNNKFWKY